MSIRRPLLALAALVAAGLPSAAAAQAWGFELAGPGRRGGPPPALGAGWRDGHADARDRVRGGDILPLPRVLGEVRRRTPGRLLDAGLEDAAGGQPVYRVRWAAADGRRIDYIVDARSGVIVRADGE